MPTRRDFDVISAANFRVEIEGVTQADFLSVEFLETLTAVMETKRGSEAAVRKSPGRHAYGDIVLRRRFDGDEALWKWRKLVLDGKVERRSGSVIITDGAATDEIARFNFFEGWPCGWRLGRWDGAVDAPLVEEVRIAVERIERG
jgi:phage tail-like protein